MLIDKERIWLKEAHPGIIRYQVYIEFHVSSIEFFPWSRTLSKIRDFYRSLPLKLNLLSVADR